jgi:glucose/arabinose dehydrogenase
MLIHIARKLLILILIASMRYAYAVDYQVEVIAEGLDYPWSIAQLDSGEFLVTQKSGSLLRIDLEGGTHLISGTPPVYYKSQGGLMEVRLHPNFRDNRWVYLSWSGGDAAHNRTTVGRARLIDDALENLEIVLEVSPDKDTAAHYGAKLAFAPDGALLVSVGEGFQYREQAQSLDSELGKLLRVNDDGSPRADNPFPDRAPRVLSYGHRNPQGLAVDAETGTIWMTEHGPRGGDELNRIEAGKNYGWPAITYGVDYSGAVISPFTEAEGMMQPVTYWVPSIATSGLAIYRGDQFPALSNQLLVGALRDRKLFALNVSDAGVEQTEPFPELEGRVRDIRVFSDGAIYVVTDEGAVLRISAANATP